MLPSSGYFRGIACPAHTRGSCSRPYCHFRHDTKVCPERNVSSSSSSSSHAIVPTPAEEEADAEDETQETLEDQDMRKDLPECSGATLSMATSSLPDPEGQEQEQQQEQQEQQQEQQQPEPHTSQPVTATGNIPKSELLHQLMSEALKKVLAENPTLASTVDASAIRIGIDPISHESPEESKTKKQFYPRPPDTPNYNPTPIRELKKRKMSVDGGSSHGYTPTGTFTGLREAKGNEEDEEGGVMGEFSSSDSEEVEEKNDDFDLLEEVLAEHSKNNKVKVKKKRVKELGKLQYSLSNADKKAVDNKVMIADAKQLTDKEVKRYEVSQPESVNKVITDGPYFLPPSPIFTSSSDGFEAFNSRASYQEEEEGEEKEKEKEKTVPDKCSDKAVPQTEPTKPNSEPGGEKNTTPKQIQEPSTSGSQPLCEKKTPKASGHTHLPKLLPTLDAPKLSRPNVRNWIPLVRNSIPVPDVRKSSDQLDEILKMMDGSDASNKRKSKENENQTSHQKDSENARPRKKYKVDLNKEIESLTNPAVDQVKETVTPEKDSANHKPETCNSRDGDEKQSTKEKDEAEKSQSEPKEKQNLKTASPKDSEDKEKRSESEAASESENSDEDSHVEESEEDSKHRRARHKKKRKRSRSSSTDSDYSHRRRKKRKRSHRRHHKRNKRSRKRKDSTSSLSDQSKDSEEEKEDEEEEDEEAEDKDNNDDKQEGEEEEEEDKKEEEEENKSEEDSESDDKDDSNDEVDHHKKSKRHRKKHKHYKKSKHKKSRRRAKRKRKRSKSYSRSRSSSGSRDSIRSRSRSRSSSKHRKKKSRSRHKSRNMSDSEERDSDKERSRSRSRSSSRNSSKLRSRESIEKDSSSSKHKESSKSKDERLEEEGRKGTKGDRKSRDRSTSKSRQQATYEEKSKNHSQEEISIPMPVDPSKIKVEKNVSNALIPDLSKVKVEKEESAIEKLSTQVNTSENAKGNDKSHEDKCKGQSESGQSKASEKIHERRRSSTEEKSRRRLSHERKDSTESTSDKGALRRQSYDSKTSDAEASQQRKRIEERRLSSDKNKMTPPISAQPSEMSMFDLILASTKKPKSKTLTEISIFDSVSAASTNDGDVSDGKGAQSDAKKKSKDASHKSGGDSSSKSSNSHTSEHKSSSSNRALKSSKSEKSAHTDSHHKHDKSENKSLHSSSKSKSNSSTHHHSRHSSSNSSNSSSTHKKSSSSSSRGSSSKHHSTSATSTTTTSTTTATTTTTPSSSSSKHSESNSSSKNKKVSDSSSSRSEKDSSRHSSTSSRKHSSGNSSSSRHQDSTSSSSNSRRRSSISSSSKHKEDKNSVTGPAKISEGSETAKKRKVSVEEDSPGGVSDDDHFSNGGDSPLPDLSVLDEIPQDDWEQMISGSDTFSTAQEPLEESDGDDMDHDDPGVLEECMKMFNEFQPGTNPLENQVLPKKIKAPSEDSKEPATAPSKQRVARSSSTGNLIVKKPSASRHQRNNPMQRMVERYQKLKEELKLKEQQLHHLQGGSSAVSSSSTSRTSVAAASSSTHHSLTSHSNSGKTKKRVAHVPNVSSLLNAQGKILNHSSSGPRNKISPKVARASGVIPETTAHTVAKGGRRIAHMPRTGALARPIIQPELGSLVPQNIRQRYLNALIEECKKFCSEKEAFSIAAAEERVCYQRAPSRMVYLNLVVNAVKRLRTQQQAGEAARELLDQDPQLAEKMCIEEPSSSSSKRSCSPSPSSSPSSSRPHPINPNHVQLSHTTVLSSGGLRGSWSIEKSKKTANSSDEALKGETFYKHLLKYVLTEEQLGENGYPCPDPEEKGKAVVKRVDTRKKISPSALERYCDRCSVLYNVDKWGFPKSSAPCVYHWGRAYKKRKYGTFETTYSCCGGEQGSDGCSQATTHVSQNYNPKNLRGYVRTISKDMSSSNKEVYALDCEMCYTTEGNELTRVTVIGCDGNVVYEQLVKPENPILDYNTRFSGITESDMEEVKLTIRDVQAALLARFSDKTILIGHSLESDLHALKMIHNTVVDTSVVFPHKMGAPYKRALKNLAAEYLKRIIQDDVSGHDSAEDAVACLHLMQWKVKEDLKGFSK